MPVADHLQTCKACQHEFRVDDGLIGTSIPCPHCRRPMTVALVRAEDRLIGQRLGGYRLTRRLGSGAIGVVYAAEPVSAGEPVALKMLTSRAAANPMLVQRFLREARICGDIRHPNIVAVKGCGRDRGVHFMIMELIDGSTLAGMINRTGPLPWTAALGYVRQIANALAHVQNLGVIHRDIKPANILIDVDGTAKLADLGLAKQTDNDASDSSVALTMQGMILGSPSYMAPEQIRDPAHVTPAADLYALGATAFHLLTGFPPFEGRSHAEVMTKVLREDPPPCSDFLPGIPAGVEQLVRRLLAKTPEERIPDARSLILEIDRVHEEPERVLRRHARPTRGRSSSGHARLILVIGLIVLALCAAVAIMIRLHHR